MNAYAPNSYNAETERFDCCEGRRCVCAKQGTRWTEPGQGATRAMLRRSLIYMDPAADTESRLAWTRAYGSIPKRAPKIYKCTNLALTGEPLTADDVRRIGEAK